MESEILQLLGGYVMRRAHDGLRTGQSVIRRCPPEELRQPKIGNLHPALLLDQDVLRFDVAMDDAFDFS